MELVQRENCFTCGACVAVCPRKAISRESEDGFRYPVIDQKKCIDCGLCKRACPAESKKQSDNVPSLYAFQHEDAGIVHKSSSGAAFTALSDAVLAQGGVVIGAVLDADHVVRHHIACNAAERDAMCGAKYVQSDMSDVYEPAANAIKQHRGPALFTGTPCQAEAFRTFCEAERLDLTDVYLCALVCHGAASPQVWKDYLEHVEETSHGDVTDINFRNKEQGWRHNRMTARIGGQERLMQSYSALFYSKLCNPRSCFACPYTTVMRNCDITIGDFWSIQKFAEGYAEGDGVSLLLAHSQKGEDLIRECAGEGTLDRIAFDPQNDSLQPALKKPYAKPLEYDSFWKDYHRLSFSKLKRKYAGLRLPDRMRRLVRRRLLAVRLKHGGQGSK
jgi:coenzyme F420-reducing hydrogenase beta subunit